VISLLYVDDETALLDIVRLSLERDGQFAVETASSAAGALDLLKTRRFDAIISDYQMPEMDGIGFLKAVRGEHGDIPFILFTGRGREEIVIEAINNGADFYLQKGGDPRSQFAELIHKIRQAVVRRRAQDELTAAIDQLAASEEALRCQLEEKERAEQERMKSEENFRNLVDNAPDAIYIQTHHRFVYLNDAAVRLLGASSADELLGKSSLDRIHPSFHGRVLERVKQLTIDLEPVEMLEELYVKVDGTPVHVEVKAVPFLYGGEHGALVIVHDITARKQAENELHSAYEQVLATEEELRGQYQELAQKEQQIRESEEKYRIFVETANEGIWAIDAGFNTTFVNRKMQEIFGYTVREMTGRPVWDFVPPDDAESMKQVLLERRTGIPGRYQRRWVRKDGSIVWCLTSATPLFSPDGTFMGSFGLFTDITERMRMDDTLRESEKKYATVVEQSQDGIFIAQDGRLVFHNRAFSTMTGYPGAELEGKGIAELIAPEDRELVMTRHQERLDGRTPPETYEFSVLYRDGETRVPVKMSIAPGTVHGKPATIGTLHNMMEERRRESVLRESEERYRSIIENIHEGFIRTDNEGCILMASPSAVRMLGYDTPDDIVGMPIVAFYRLPDTRQVMLDRIREHRRIDGYQIEFRKKDGSSFWGSLDAHFVCGKDGEVLGTEALIRDISEHRAMESAVKEANRKLNLLNSITRHDVKNQIAVLLGYADIAATDVPADEVGGYLARIRDVARKISQLIDCTGTYQELGVHSPGWFNVGDIVNQVGMPQVRTGDHCDQYEIFSDPMLERVFFNLFDNAVRHGGNVTEIKVQCRESPAGLTIVVSDNGAGIPETDKEKIFERGYGRNTGYGLFLAREILAITGISIRETGTVGEGARFEILVPEGAFRDVPQST